MENRMLNTPREPRSKKLSKKTLAIFAKGVRTTEDIVKATSALAADLAAGKLQTRELAVICRGLKISLRTKSQQLRRDRLEIRRARMEIELLRRNAVKSRQRRGVIHK
jgi:hypothetical protein